MKKIDARGLPCPQPTVLVKRAMEDGEDEIEVIVDDSIARENVIRLARKMNYDCDISEYEEGFLLFLAGMGPAESCSRIGESTVYLIKSETIGTGDDQLGAILMKGYLYSLTEQGIPPSHLVFMNGGVKLVVQGSEHLDNLNKLHEAGTEILSCGTCLDYFGLKDRLAVGIVSNMYDILDILGLAASVVSI